MVSQEIIKTGVLPIGWYWSVNPIGEFSVRLPHAHSRASVENRELGKVFRVWYLDTPISIPDVPFSVWGEAPEQIDTDPWSLGLWAQESPDWMHYAGETVDDVKDVAQEVGAVVASAAKAIPSAILIIGAGVLALGLGYFLLKK